MALLIRCVSIFLLFATIDIALADTAPPDKGRTNTVLIGAHFTTMDPALPDVEALAYGPNGKIIALGDVAQVIAIAGAKAKRIDLGGAYVLPGFHDVHVHALEAGINASRCVLAEFGSLAQYRRQITHCAAEQADAPWFIGAGVSMPDLLAQTSHPIDLLDKLFPDRPVLVLDNLGHGAWANRAAMAAVGYDRLKGNPPGGIIDRDAQGRLTGIVFENAQQALRNAALPPNGANLDANYDALKEALKVLAQNGITSISDAGGYWTRGHHLAWQRAARDGVLNVRASNALYVFPDLPMDQQIADIIALKESVSDTFLHFDQAKIYVDGILSQGTAALYAPYTHAPAGIEVSNRGFAYFDKSTLFDVASRLDKAGFSLHFHATGDRGVGLALDAIEEARRRNGVSGNHHRVTHVFLVDQRDRARFAALGVSADIQMTPSSLDPDYLAFLRDVLGAKRAAQLIPAAALLEAKAPMTLSSDWDADTLSPLVKIQTTVMRKNQGIKDVHKVVQMMTISSARLLGQDDLTGSLEVGKFADLVVLDRDIFTMPPNQIAKIKIRATMLGGKATYDPDTILGP